MKTTIDMAREAGVYIDCAWRYEMKDNEDSLKAFADLVRADEREETDRLRALCDELLSELYVYRASKYLKDTTEAIRARGNI
jgi:hypothetical protein